MKNLTVNSLLLLSALLFSSCLDKNSEKNAATVNPASQGQTESSAPVTEPEAKVYAPYFEEKEGFYSTVAEVVKSRICRISMKLRKS